MKTTESDRRNGRFDDSDHRPRHAVEIRVIAFGLVAIWVRCPVKQSRLAVLPLYFYRIEQVGARCTGEVDRSELCYCCSRLKCTNGQVGDKAAQCSSAPNSSLCTVCGPLAKNE